MKKVVLTYCRHYTLSVEVRPVGDRFCADVLDGAERLRVFHLPDVPSAVTFIAESGDVAYRGAVVSSLRALAHTLEHDSDTPDRIVIEIRRNRSTEVR